MLLLFNLWHTCVYMCRYVTLWTINATVQLHNHAQYVCALALVMAAYVHLHPVWSLCSWSFMQHSFVMLNVQIVLRGKHTWTPPRTVQLTDLCLHTHTHTITWYTTQLTHREMYMYMGRGLAWGSVTVPWRGCWVWFYCLYWSWLRLSRAINMWIIGGS